MTISTRLAAAAVIAVAAAASCSSAPPASTTATARATPASLGCAWYSATATPGEVVNVTATGPACGDRSLIGWLAADTDRAWASEGVIPGSFGTLLATLSRNGTTVRVWFTGPAESPGATIVAGSAAALAGRIANALQAAGWAPVT